MITMNELLEYLTRVKASDMHICPCKKPSVRIDGELTETDIAPLTPEQVKSLLFSILNEEQKKSLIDNRELDIAYMLHGVSRFRLNVYMQRGTYAAAIRAIPFDVPSMDELGVPSIVRSFADQAHGLVLITGPQGSGKTTTLASIVDYINQTRKSHIVSIEDPIEYLHKSKKSVVNQREIGKDTKSFKDAMKYILRQDLDVCLIGEIRDVDTVQTALTLAEAGILVLSTLHSPNAAESVSRIVDMFPPDYQHPVKTQLSLALKAVVSQQLIQRRNKKGRVLACEIMKVTNSISNMIRHFSVKQIHSMIQTGRAEGMQTMDQALAKLYTDGKISKFELTRRVSDLEQVDMILREIFDAA